MPAGDQDLTALLRGVDTILPDGALEERLAEGGSLRVKLGVDPTAPDVHLGWAVVLRKLRQFQELGHTAVLILGDFTAQVGDPSDRSETRKRLDAEVVRGYSESCLSMLRPLLRDDRLDVRYNSEWLAGMDMQEVLELTGQVTVAQMLDRDDFSKRYREHEPISLMELLYPLLQGYDSVAVEADVELGGTDQLWNLLVGRTLQERHGQRPQIALTVPLLVGTDGVQKMSQSYGNYISVRDEPADMFGKVMSIPDDAMPQYFLLATDLPHAEVEAIVSGLGNRTRHPGETKRLLAGEVVRVYWGREAAREAEEAFDRVFRDRRLPDDVAEYPLPDADPIWLPGFLKEAGLVGSSSEGRRMVEQGGVRIDGEPVASEEIGRDEVRGRIIQVGKRRFVRAV